MCFPCLKDFDPSLSAGGGSMRHLQVDRVQQAIHAPNRRSRNRAIDWLSRQGDIAGLIRVLNHAKYQDASRKAEAKLEAYSFK